MDIEVLTEGEGLADVESVALPAGALAGKLIEAVAAKAGYPATEALLFAEDEAEPVATETPMTTELVSGRVYHVHRARKVDVSVSYKADSKNKGFPPSSRFQTILDWVTGPDGFAIDPAIAPEMELAIHGETTPLPKSAHIGRYVNHPENTLALDLIRGVVPNGGPR